MKFKNKFRLIITQKLSSIINSNIDKTLFKNFKKNDLPILRLYSWEDCITFGAGQNLDDYKKLQDDYNNNVSKRVTGGGVLFHGHDISYTIVIDPEMINNKDVKETYFLLCQFLIKFYENLGLKAKFAKEINEISLSKSPFCQVGFEAYDIIIDGKKIGGNAQKRSKNCILQHGSIPLFKKSDDEIFGSSLEDFGVKISFDIAKDALQKAFQEVFEVEFIEDSLNKDEKNILEKLIKDE
ncbi:lipoate--protein ligase family protein [Aliarcobacter thereius]|uniref:Octanoyltransferase LipM n=1 Tax=Aliarcobacter thereius LMG 24486 TaxID=1032240 RepID=A0A1C7WTR1_9BACT|nr:ligase [Aliarcobacter thereius]OCL96265.1 Octanoyltransferase LipM [Aliarcobacter thereius LMG 24486]QBF15770.1 lipoate--protein ligase A [Aliarcobacter thereius LMG 24486]TLS92451.1 lipoate--protein ligase family protein [Aliarcobacter thereius]